MSERSVADSMLGSEPGHLQCFRCSVIADDLRLLIKAAFFPSVIGKYAESKKPDKKGSI